MNTLQNALISLKSVYQRQHVSLSTARTKLVESLTYKQYQAARVQGFFQVDRVSKVSKSKRLNLLAQDVLYMQGQLSETGRELDEILKELER